MEPSRSESIHAAMLTHAVGCVRSRNPVGDLGPNVPANVARNGRSTNCNRTAPLVVPLSRTPYFW
jgi:hypothetical protein